MGVERSQPQDSLSFIDAMPSLAAAPDRPEISNGAITAIIDQAGSVAIWSGLGLQLPHATVTLSATYLGAARTPRLHVGSRVTSLEHGLGHTAVEARDDDGRLVAQAMVNYALGSYPGGVPMPSILPPREPDEGEMALGPLKGKGLGPAMGWQAQDDLRARIAFRHDLVGSQNPVAWHGGAIAAGIVLTGEHVVPTDRALRLSHLVIDYLRSGLAQDIVFTATKIGESRKTMTLRLDATQDGGARHVAAATARFFVG